MPTSAGGEASIFCREGTTVMKIVLSVLALLIGISVVQRASGAQRWWERPYTDETNVQDGELGNYLGLIVGDALGVPGAHDSLDALVNNGPSAGWAQPLHLGSEVEHTNDTPDITGNFSGGSGASASGTPSFLSPEAGFGSNGGHIFHLLRGPPNRNSRALQ
jgi:hypothetical protein